MSHRARDASATSTYHFYGSILLYTLLVTLVFPVSRGSFCKALTELLSLSAFSLTKGPRPPHEGETEGEGARVERGCTGEVASSQSLAGRARDVYLRPGRSRGRGLSEAPCYSSRAPPLNLDTRTPGRQGSPLGLLPSASCGR